MEVIQILFTTEYGFSRVLLDNMQGFNVQRYVYIINKKPFVFYKVGLQWFYGRGCHMRALSYNNTIRPTKRLSHKPV